MLEKVKQFVDELFAKSVYPNTPQHLQSTLDCLLKIKIDADEAMQIAAYSHDLARAYAKTNFEGKAFDDPEYLAEHQEVGAKAICDFLKSENYDQDKIDRIYNMVRHHEEGGDDESNLLMDVDSWSYLINPAHLKPHFLQTLGKIKIKTKFEYMYNRISSSQVRELARPYYEKDLEILESIK